MVSQTNRRFGFGFDKDTITCYFISSVHFETELSNHRRTKMGKLIFSMFCAALLTACGPSAKEMELAEKLSRSSASLASREAIDELNRAREQAHIAGARFASDGKLIRSYQCSTRLAAEKLAQLPAYKRFASEMMQPFQDGCVREARIVLKNLQLAAEKAAKERAAKKMRLAAAAKKGNKK